VKPRYRVPMPAFRSDPAAPAGYAWAPVPWASRSPLRARCALRPLPHLPRSAASAVLSTCRPQHVVAPASSSQIRSRASQGRAGRRHSPARRSPPSPRRVPRLPVPQRGFRSARIPLLAAN